LADLKLGQQQFPGKFFDLAGVFVVSAIIRGNAPGIQSAVSAGIIETGDCDFQMNFIQSKKQHLSKLIAVFCLTTSIDCRFP
jgi:hypothetical protein